MHPARIRNLCSNLNHDLILFQITRIVHPLNTQIVLFGNTNLSFDENVSLFLISKKQEDLKIILSALFRVRMYTVTWI